MSNIIRVSRSLYDAATEAASAEGRSVVQQIEYWAKLGKAALDNPDLPIDFIREVLMAQGQDRHLAEPFV